MSIGSALQGQAALTRTPYHKLDYAFQQGLVVNGVTLPAGRTARYAPRVLPAHIARFTLRCRPGTSH